MAARGRKLDDWGLHDGPFPLFDDEVWAAYARGTGVSGGTGTSASGTTERRKPIRRGTSTARRGSPVVSPAKVVAARAMSGKPAANKRRARRD